MAELEQTARRQAGGARARRPGGGRRRCAGAWPTSRRGPPCWPSGWRRRTRRVRPADRSRRSRRRGRPRRCSDEVAALEAALDEPAAESAEAPGPAPELQGRTLLYVGGRPKQVEQLRALTARFGGLLLSHDGGVEDSPTLLPGLVSQADVAFFPVDCVSHHAAGQVKRLCREAAEAVRAAAHASLASFAAAVGTMGCAAAAE